MIDQLIRREISVEITVNKQAQRFYLAFDKWRSAVGHEIKVGDYRFCAIPLSRTINISEITSGAKVYSIPISFEILLETATKEGSLNFFKKVGASIKRIIESTENFDEQLVNMKKTAFERLGEMPSIEKIDILID